MPRMRLHDEHPWRAERRDAAVCLRVSAACLLLFVCAALAFGEGTRLRFTHAVDLTDSGIRILLPAESVADPVPPPAVMDGVRDRGGQRERIEAQSPLEAWRWRQREGRWVDAKGTRCILVAASLSVPDSFPEWLPREEISKFLTPLASSGRSWKNEDLVRWLEQFGDVSGLVLEQIQRGRPFGLEDAYLISGPPAKRFLGAVFRLKSGPETWHFALLDLAPGVDYAAAAKAMRDDFLPAIQILGKRAAVRASPAQASGNGPQSARDESAKRARESIRNMKGWWFEESKHTIVLSNIRSGKSQLVSAILEDLEALRQSWEEIVPPWESNREVAVIRVFSTAEDYVRYVGQERAWTAGVYVSMQRELVVRPMEEGSVMKNRRAVLATVYHEAFHQYLDEAFERVQAAPWFNEGYASLFAAVDLTSRGAKVEKDPDAIGVLSRLVREDRADPARILFLDYPDFYGKDDALRREHYALAWGVMYFLQAAETNKKLAPWRGIPARYAAALKESRSQSEATAKAFEGVNMAEFARAFQAYWK